MPRYYLDLVGLDEGLEDRFGIELYDLEEAKQIASGCLAVLLDSLKPNKPVWMMVCDDEKQPLIHISPFDNVFSLSSKAL